MIWSWPDREGAHGLRLGRHLDPGIPAGIEKASVTALACGFVLFENADIGWMLSMLQDLPDEPVHGAVVVVVDRRVPLEVLPEHDKRALQGRYCIEMSLVEDGSNEDEAVDLVLVREELKI
jgi:hypothetical protein